MEAIALADAGLGRVFPSDEHDEVVQQAVSLANEHIVRLAGHIGGRAGWTGRGIEYHAYPSGQVQLVAFAESADATFWAELRPAGYFADDVEPAGWYVACAITVRCDHQQDCGTHTVEARDERHVRDASAAATAFLADVRWLVERGEAEARDHWRDHDPHAPRTQDRRGC